ncbi:HNH endonuclease signature motif containing protein [Streptococcus merionis]|uniref:HNH endonuclease signature motif containing protein n=1 Tax=Streptococcus merionis TaxID=400065 RepID=UPI0035146453
MREICHGRLTPEVTKLLNAKFGTNYTKTQIGGVRKRLGLPVGKVFAKKILSKEQHDYFIKNHAGKTAKEFAQELNKKFGLSLTPRQVKSYRGNNDLNSGLTGHFKKGSVPHNKGKKYPNLPPNSGQFQKGNRPPNHLEVGTISYTTDGYPKIKVAEPDVWEYLHRKTWEEHNGPIPGGYSVVFLDGDKTNWDISNLACLSKNEVARMNQNHLFSPDAEMTKAGIGYTKLTNKIREVENG